MNKRHHKYQLISDYNLNQIIGGKWVKYVQYFNPCIRWEGNQCIESNPHTRVYEYNERLKKERNVSFDEWDGIS